VTTFHVERAVTGAPTERGTVVLTGGSTWNLPSESLDQGKRVLGATPVAPGIGGDDADGQ
jgi:hypothetical protein